MDPKKIYYSKLALQVVKELERRGFGAHYLEDKNALLDYVVKLVPENSVVSWGGSESLKDSGVLDYLRSGKFKTLDRDTAETPEELTRIYREAMSADYYFMSTNALTMDGKLVNIDGRGNRVAALCYGPSCVVVAAGINKIVKTEQSALDRVKNHASPMNVIRLSKNTPCSETAKCEHCLAPESICSHTVITRRTPVPGRIKVLIVGEELGY